MQARPYWSVGPVSGSPSICSGAAYPTVPLKASPSADGVGRQGRAREPEVGQQRVIAVEEDVAGLDVAMDQAGGVRRVERARNIADDARRRVGVERLACQPVGERAARDVAHREEQPPSSSPAW